MITFSGTSVIIPSISDAPKSLNEVGNFFFFEPYRRSADVRSVGYSELLCLSQKDLMEVRSHFLYFLSIPSIFPPF